MYIPRHWHNFFPFCLLLVGLYVGENYPPTYDVVLFCISIYLLALSVAYYYAKAGILYQRYVTWIDGMESEVKAVTEKVVTKQQESVPTINTFGKPTLVSTFTKTVPPPVVSTKEKHFALTLLRQKDYGNGSEEYVDLTETTWVRPDHFSRKEFVKLIDKWKYNGVIARKSNRENSTYQVKNWVKVRDVASGKTLEEIPKNFPTSIPNEPIA